MSVYDGTLLGFLWALLLGINILFIYFTTVSLAEDSWFRKFVDRGNNFILSCVAMIIIDGISLGFLISFQNNGGIIVCQ